MNEHADVIDERMDLLETAWGIIANACGGNWDDAHNHPDWKAAAKRWRDDYHAQLDKYLKDAVSVETIDVPCDCQDGPCGWVHRKVSDE